MPTRVLVSHLHLLTHTLTPVTYIPAQPDFSVYLRSSSQTLDDANEPDEDDDDAPELDRRPGCRLWLWPCV